MTFTPKHSSVHAKALQEWRQTQRQVETEEVVNETPLTGQINMIAGM
jgi:hypothetical protein